MNNLPKCYSCVFMVIKDYGYSDWTVEGSMVQCLKYHFEEREKSNDYDKDYAEQNGYLAACALNCTNFKKGDPLELNVDCDQEDSMNQRLLKYQKGTGKTWKIT